MAPTTKIARTNWTCEECGEVIALDFQITAMSRSKGRVAVMSVKTEDAWLADIAVHMWSHEDVI